MGGHLPRLRRLSLKSMCGNRLDNSPLPGTICDRAPGAPGVTGGSSPRGQHLRILFVVPPMTGHINPTVAVGAELAARGHEVAWAGHLAVLPPLLPLGAQIFPVTADAPGGPPMRLADHGRPPVGPGALKFVWESLVMPLGHA